MNEVFCGITDEEFLRDEKIPMTKKEIRMMTLMSAKIKSSAIVWDIGAGTGSLSIEAAKLAYQGQVFAIERNERAIALLNRNKEKFFVRNLTIVKGVAPEGLKDLPDPDAILIGGTGGKLEEIFDCCFEKLKKNCLLVMNCIAAESLAKCFAYLDQHKIAYEAMQIQITRWHKVGNYHLAKAQNPISIVVCKKGE